MLYYIHIFTYKKLLYKGRILPMRQDSFRLATGTFCLAALVLANAYGSTLFSFLAAPKLQPIPNTLEELGQRADLKVLVQFNTVISQRIIVSIYRGI